MVDARYGRGGTTPARLRSALVGHSFTAARRIGKLLLLDTDDGPTLGLRFGMTGGLVVDGAQALDRLQYGPGVFNDKWVRVRITFADGGQPPLHHPRRFGSVEIAVRRGPPGARRAGPSPSATCVPHWRTRPGGSGNGGAPQGAPWTRSVWPAWAISSPTRSCGGPSWRPAAGHRSTDEEMRALHKQSSRSTLRQLGRPAARTWAT